MALRVVILLGDFAGGERKIIHSHEGAHRTRPVSQISSNSQTNPQELVKLSSRTGKEQVLLRHIAPHPCTYIGACNSNPRSLPQVLRWTRPVLCRKSGTRLVFCRL